MYGAHACMHTSDNTIIKINANTTHTLTKTRIMFSLEMYTFSLCKKNDRNLLSHRIAVNSCYYKLYASQYKQNRADIYRISSKNSA